MKNTVQLFFSFIICISINYTAQGSGSDSLESVLQTQLPDTLRIKILGDLCFAYRSTDTAKAWQYGNHALELSQKINYETGIAQSYNDLGIMLYNKGDYDKALAYYNESLKIRQRQNDQKGIAAIYVKVGIVYQTRSEYKQALQNQLKALKIYEKIAFEYGIAQTLNNVAVLYGNMEMYDKSLEYHKRSMEIKEKIGDFSGLSGSLSNIGSVYFKRQQFEEAISYFRKAEKIQRERSDYNYLAGTLNNLGNCYKMTDRRGPAVQCIREAYEIRKQLNDKPGIVSCLQNLAQVYLLQSEYTEGPGDVVKLMEEALSISLELGTKKETEKIYETLSNAWQMLGDHKKAFTFYNLGRAYHDSIYNEETTRQIAEMQTLYETEKKEQSIKLLTKDNEIRQEELDRKRTTMQIMLGGLAVVSLLLVLILRLYRQKIRANEKLVQLDKEKNEFLGIAAHDLKNPLQTIMGYCQMQVEYFDKLSKDKILKYTSHIEQSARRMIVLISNLLDINAIEQGTIRSQPETINLPEFISKANQHFEVSSKQKDITIHTSCPQDLALYTDHYMLSQVYENLLSNAIKYSPLHSSVWVTVIKQQGNISIAIQDSGPGIPAGESDKLFKKFSRLSSRPTAGESSNGLGLSIVKKLCDMLQADVQCESETGKGATFIVTFTQRAPAV